MGKKRTPSTAARLAATVAIVAVVCAAAALLILAYFSPVQKTQGTIGSINIYLQPASGMAENSSLTVRAFSSCGPFLLYLDGKEIGRGDGQLETAVLAKAGSHTLRAKSGQCEETREFEVVSPACAEGENQSCLAGGCQGARECREGAWGGCILPPKVCDPGEQVGCGLNECKFGYRTCNSCGTAFGPCLEQGSGPLAANSLGCLPAD